MSDTLLEYRLVARRRGTTKKLDSFPHNLRDALSTKAHLRRPLYAYAKPFCMLKVSSQRSADVTVTARNTS
eukprot:1382967-Pleurochrysis_carterae.AAC.1